MLIGAIWSYIEKEIGRACGIDTHPGGVAGPMTAGDGRNAELSAIRLRGVDGVCKLGKKPGYQWQVKFNGAQY